MISFFILAGRDMTSPYSILLVIFVYFLARVWSEHKLGVTKVLINPEILGLLRQVGGHSSGLSRLGRFRF